jgi:arylsulfatase A-like enzyme
VLAVGTGACEKPPASPPPPVNVVLIVMDTARADHFSCYGYGLETTPNIDAFARDAVLYRHARAPSPWTLPSHASLFTGLPPGLHGLHWSGIPADGEELPPRLSKLAPAAEGRLLAARLKNRGYATFGVSNNPMISARNRLDGGFDTFLWRPKPPAEDSRADWSLSLIQKRFAQQEVPEPFFLFLNLIEPHFPYDPPAAFHGRFGGDISKIPTEERLEMSMVAGARAIDPEALIPLYDEELSHTDDVVGRLLAWLRERGLYRSSLIIITSDHGEFLGEGGRYSHQLSLAPELIWIPLIIKYPGNEYAGTVEESPMVSLTDVYRTVLAAAGAHDPDRETWSQDLRRMDRFSRRWTLSEYFYSVKYLRQLKRLNPDFDVRAHEVVRRLVFSGGEEHLFYGDDLTPAAGDGREVGASLSDGVLAELDAYLRSPRGATVFDDSLGDADAIEALRALGYVGD